MIRHGLNALSVYPLVRRVVLAALLRLLVALIGRPALRPSAGRLALRLGVHAAHLATIAPRAHLNQ
jgi:hypothetical protein